MERRECALATEKTESRCVAWRWLKGSPFLSPSSSPMSFSQRGKGAGVLKNLPMSTTVILTVGVEEEETPSSEEEEEEEEEDFPY